MIKRIILSLALCSITTIHIIRTADLPSYKEALLFDYQISTTDATKQEWKEVIDKTHNFLSHIKQLEANLQKNKASKLKLITELGSYMQSTVTNLKAYNGAIAFHFKHANNIATKTLEDFFTVEHYNNLIVLRGALLRNNEGNHQLWQHISMLAQELVQLSHPDQILAFTSNVISMTNLALQDNSLQFAIGIY